MHSRIFIQPQRKVKFMAFAGKLVEVEIRNTIKHAFSHMWNLDLALVCMNLLVDRV